MPKAHSRQGEAQNREPKVNRPKFKDQGFSHFLPDWRFTMITSRHRHLPPDPFTGEESPVPFAFTGGGSKPDPGLPPRGRTRFSPCCHGFFQGKHHRSFRQL
ncbi:hypothetical protein AKJ40_00940 [candidate division MSBL1 archaeon SCGC-AAA259M10]|uniref:Uncharacterized protein n=1 Tax=candidate division MSBL1 archaeon SCGC-AAA259M10 TaxID=1698270 RepID=A0A133V2R3_9EURY|nr:hypothetical protein AKJ40_00940 [candidate division MSBL1 archaeon SCGC-AAA259M10]